MWKPLQQEYAWSDDRHSSQVIKAEKRLITRFYIHVYATLTYFRFFPNLCQNDRQTNRFILKNMRLCCWNVSGNTCRIAWETSRFWFDENRLICNEDSLAPKRFLHFRSQRTEIKTIGAKLFYTSSFTAWSIFTARYRPTSMHSADYAAAKCLYVCYDLVITVTLVN